MIFDSHNGVFNCDRSLGCRRNHLPTENEMGEFKGGHILPAISRQVNAFLYIDTMSRIVLTISGFLETNSAARIRVRNDVRFWNSVLHLWERALRRIYHTEVVFMS